MLLRPWKGRDAREYIALKQSLVEAEDSDVPPMVIAYLDGQPAAFECDVDNTDERAFVVMCALDDAAMIIHPSVKSRRAGRAAAVGGMLARMRIERTMNGSYGEITGSGFVAPKGPLMPGRNRSDGADLSGTSLAHHFSFLSFVPAPGKHYELLPLVLPPSRIDVSAASGGLVGLAPIALDKDDLEFRTCERGKRPFVDTVAKQDLLKTRAKTEVTALLDKGAGIVILPELVTSSETASDLADHLRTPAGSQNAMILAGSGPSAETSADIGRPFNEAVILSGSGDVLFRQRKLNAFNIGWKRMKECALPPAEGHEKHAHMEDCATGHELVVCDIAGLGRVMVLICEDLEQQTPGGDICLHAMPDWVLTPVLDVGLSFGRWEHRRAIEIGRKTGSRFVVSSSATLQVRSLKKERLAETDHAAVITGFCLDGSLETRSKHVETGGDNPPQHMIVEWKPETWKQAWIVEGTSGE